jgi:3-phosphoshikimate 1-carboxyvinyltransferase
LNSLGANILYTNKSGFPPLLIKSAFLKGGEVNVDASKSSQFVSALMMIGPAMKNGLQIQLDDDPASLPYIRMTEKLMLSSGAKVLLGNHTIMVNGTGYGHAILPNEADWSAAAFWYEIFALSREKNMFIDSLEEKSLQGDAMAERYFRMLGVETVFRGGGAWLSKFYWSGDVIRADLSYNPDLAPALIVATAARRKAGEFTGLKNLRYKESDRLHALLTELGKAGIACNSTSGSLSFEAQQMNITEPLNTYDDHRLAMAFAPLAFMGTPVTINDPDVVSKSYPGFWDEIQKVLSVEF